MERLSADIGFKLAHRITGLFIMMGVVMYTVWLVALALGEEVFAYYTLLQCSWLGSLLLFLWVFSMFFHLLTGIAYIYVQLGGKKALVLSKRSITIITSLSFVVSTILWFNSLGI